MVQSTTAWHFHARNDSLLTSHPRRFSLCVSRKRKSQPTGLRQGRLVADGRDHDTSSIETRRVVGVSGFGHPGSITASRLAARFSNCSWSTSQCPLTFGLGWSPLLPDSECQIIVGDVTPTMAWWETGSWGAWGNNGVTDTGLLYREFETSRVGRIGESCANQYLSWSSSVE